MRPAWRQRLELALAAQADDPTSRYFQLATIGLDGRPACRTLVHRGFLDGTDDLVSTTDARSAKAREIGLNPSAEISWYLAATRDQFRLAGRISFLEPEDVQRLETWRSISSPSRDQFNWPAPGGPFEPGASLPPIVSGGVTTPPETFLVLIFRVDRVEQLHLTGRPHERTLSESIEGVWRDRRVNP